LLDHYEYATFIYNEAENDPKEFISGLPTKVSIKKAVEYNSGKLWKSTKDRIEKITTKIHQLMVIRRKQAHK
jgi:hypothetical protein